MQPQLVGRDRELARLRRAVSRGRGAVVTGDAGVGRSRLVADALAAIDAPTTWIRALATTAEAPLAAFAPLGPQVVKAAQDPSVAVLAFGAVREAMRDVDASGGQRPVLVVDDAHQLDPLSASTLFQLVVLDVVTVVAIVKARVPLREPIVALWTDAGCDRLAVPPLGRAETEQLARELLGGPTGPRAMQQLWMLSRGNPLLLRELVHGGVEAGTLSEQDGRWRLAGDLSTADRLMDLIRARLRQLPDGAASAAELLALAEPVDPALFLAVAAAEDLLPLEEAGMAERRQDASGATLLAFAHPLYGEVLRVATPQARHAANAARLAEAAASTRTATVDRLRLAAWRLEGGLARPDELLAAAELAISRMAANLAVRLARAACITGTPEARLVLGQALLASGDAVNAEVELRQVHAASPAVATRVQAAIALATVYLRTPDRLDDALAVLDAEAARPDIAGQDAEMLVAARAMAHMLLGNLDAAVAATERPVADAERSDAIRLLFLTARSLVCAVEFDPQRARELVTSGLELLRDLPVAPPGAADLLHANACAASLLEGDLASARAAVDARRRLAMEADRTDLLALWYLLDAQTTLAEGSPGSSADIADEAVRLLLGHDPFTIGPLAHVEAAHAAAVAGDTARARDWLARVPSSWKLTRRLASRDATVRAWLTLAEHGVEAAVDDAVRAGDQAAADGVFAWALEAWHLAVRLGDAGAVLDRLSRLAASTPTRRVTLTLAHATALADRDPVALERSAVGLRDAGYLLVACETAAQAAAAFRRIERADRARGAVLLAATCLPSPVLAANPILTELSFEPGLTPREREIAGFAARGLTSRDIAERLHISRRTVDNRLASVYRKLGITGRAELRTLFPVADGPR